MNALMGPEERALLAQSGVRAVVERLVARQPEAFWSQHAMLVGFGGCRGCLGAGLCIRGMGKCWP